MMGFWIAVLVYGLVVVGLGVVASRRGGVSPEEYFLAGRKLRRLVLFMALFGTNMTAFVLIGVPGQAYHSGVGVFGLNAAIACLGIPLTFWIVGVPVRRLAAEYGAVTPVELYSARLGSRGVGLLLFGFFVLYTIPYMVTGLRGAAIMLAGVTEGRVSAEMGAGAVVVVALLYTALGGMRATAWTNIVQAALFLGFMLVAFLAVGNALGGIGPAMEAVVASQPRLLELGEERLFGLGVWVSWALAICLTVISFPHILSRLMAAQDDDSLRSTCRLYPPAIAALWFPSVVLGVWGAISFPGLVGAESDRIFALVVSQYLPAWLVGIGFVGVLAAVMSTLDAQLLTLGSMFVRDLMPALRRELPADSHVKAARVVIVFLAVVVWSVERLIGDSVYELARFAFSGFAVLAPVVILGIRWSGLTSAGAVGSIMAGNAVLLLGELGVVPSGAFLPVFWGFLVALLGALVGSYFTRSGEREAVESETSENGERMPTIGSEQRQNIRDETEHYFQAELAHEQRASWLIALGSALLVGTTQYLLKDEGQLGGVATLGLWAAVLFFLAGTVAAIVAIWPLGGSAGDFWSVRYRARSTTEVDEWSDSDGWIWRHFLAHRLRALKKGARVTWAIIALLCGFGLGAAAVVVEMLVR